jgi:uncharacterized protein involved in tellurium resistance
MKLGIDFDLVAIDKRLETDEGGEEYTVKYGLYINKQRKKSILVSMYRYEGEPDFEKVEKVLSSIPADRYKELELSITKNPAASAIYISEVYGTTGDFKVIYDEYFEDINEAIVFLWEIKDSLKGNPVEYEKYLFAHYPQ